MSGNTLRVAVTGVAGASGQSVMKALFAAQVRDQNDEPVAIEVYPVDCQPFSMGLYRGKCGGTVLPKPEQDINAWITWLIDEKIDLLIPGADRDLPPMANIRTHMKGAYGIEIMVSSPSLVECANDKFRTIAELGKHKVPVPKTAITISNSYIIHEEYPAIVKPRYDAASRGVFLCHNQDDFDYAVRHVTAPVIQEYLDGPEFTCGLICDRYGDPAIFMMKRELYAGSTYRGEVGWWPELEPILIQTAKAFQPRGPLNVQLRLTKDGPEIFELNARMSGSSAIRAHFGFNEAEMLISHYIYGKPINQQARYRRGYVMRYWEEMYLDGVTEAEIEQYSGKVPVKGKIPSWL